MAAEELPQVLQLFAHLDVERVQHFGAIERDGCNAVVALFVQQSFVVGHSRSLGRPGGTANLPDLHSAEHPTCAGERQPPLNRSNRRTSAASSSSTPTISSTSPSSAARVAVIAFDGPKQRQPIDLRLRKRATQPSSMNRRKTTTYRRFTDTRVARGDHRVGVADELQCKVEDVATKADAERLEQSRRFRCNSHRVTGIRNHRGAEVFADAQHCNSSNCGIRLQRTPTSVTPASSLRSGRECKRTIDMPSS